MERQSGDFGQLNINTVHLIKANKFQGITVSVVAVFHCCSVELARSRPKARQFFIFL